MDNILLRFSCISFLYKPPWIYTAANVFRLQSWVNVSVRRNYEDHIRPHLLTCLKSGHFNKFPSSKSGEKVLQCQEKKKNLLYFVTANFHVYGATAKMKVCYSLPFKYSLITLRFFKKNTKILASLRILIKTGVLNLQIMIA